MSGFLHGARAAGSPPDSAIRPLRPRLWRSVPVAGALRARHRAGGALPAGAQRPLGLPGQRLERPRARPGATSPAGSGRCARAARSLRGLPGGVGRVERARQPGLLDRHARAVLPCLRDGGARARQDELGDERRGRRAQHHEAASPSWLEGLLRHCRARGCRVGFLSFHANLAAPTSRSPALESDLRRCARWCRATATSSLSRRRGERVDRPRRPVPARRDPRLPPAHGGGRGRRGRALVLARPRRGRQLLERHARGTAHARRAGRAAPGGPTAPTPRAWTAGCRAAPTPPPWRCSPAGRTVTGGGTGAAGPPRPRPTRPRRPLSVELTLRGLAARACPARAGRVVDVEPALGHAASSRSPHRPWSGRRTIAVGAGDVTLPVGALRPAPGAGRRASAPLSAPPQSPPAA